LWTSPTLWEVSGFSKTVLPYWSIAVLLPVCSPARTAVSIVTRLRTGSTAEESGLDTRQERDFSLNRL
jgi:hypothetical protein